MPYLTAVPTNADLATAPAPTTLTRTQSVRTASQEVLVRRARRGDRVALDQLCRDHRSAAVRACLSITRNRDDAEDAAQEALIIVSRRISALREDTNFAAYLTVVARRVAMRRAAAGRLTTLDGSGMLETLAADEHHACPELTVLRRETSAAVARAMESLPDRQRTALVRTAVTGDSYAEVGAAIGLQANAVAQLVHRARVNVRSSLAAAA